MEEKINKSVFFCKFVNHFLHGGRGGGSSKLFYSAFGLDNAGAGRRERAPARRGCLGAAARALPGRDAGGCPSPTDPPISFAAPCKGREGKAGRFPRCRLGPAGSRRYDSPAGFAGPWERNEQTARPGPPRRGPAAAGLSPAGVSGAEPGRAAAAGSARSRPGRR